MRAPRVFGLLLGLVAVAAVMLLLVLPGRTYLAQRHSMAAAETRLKVLSTENARLAGSAQRLESDSEIERLARQQYGLVKPGEQAFAILPSHDRAPAPAARPAAKPGVLGRLWRAAQIWR